MKQTKELKEWAIKIKERDSNKCVICGSIKNLNAHHILPRELKTTALDLNNGITLCPLHHRFSFKMSAHQNPMAFYRWLFLERNQQYIYLLTKLEEVYK